jgi:hypothetical protein
MNPSILNAIENNIASLKRGILRSITKDGWLVVELQTRSKELLKCHWLENGERHSIRLARGDDVLVAISPEPQERPCVLGRVGRYASSHEQGEEKQDRNPESLVLKADQQIVLSCGDSTITLRHDGKVLITGVDVVSRAARTQRIKGGSVQIN